jgi:hypothetical protein
MNGVEFKESRAIGATPFTKEDIVSFARFGRIPTADGRRRGLVKRVEVFAQQHVAATYSLGVLTRMADQLDGPILSFKQSLYDLTQAGERFVSPRKSGRYVEIEFATTGQDKPWELTGFAVEMQQMGIR